MKRGDVYRHPRSGDEYVVLSVDAKFKALWWWIGPFVIYRSGVNPQHIYIRTRRNFAARFYRVASPSTKP